MNLSFKIPNENLYLTIENNLIEEISDIVKKYYPKEFGGVFLGEYSSNMDTVHINEVITPRKFHNSRFLFIRYPKFINKKIKEAFDKSHGQNIYIGEWHSHPNGTTNPSPVDISTIKNISTNKKVNINSPIMSILTYDGFEIQYTFYLIFKLKLFKYERI